MGGGEASPKVHVRLRLNVEDGKRIQQAIYASTSEPQKSRLKATHNNNNNVHLSCAHKRHERAHDTY